MAYADTDPAKGAAGRKIAAASLANLKMITSDTAREMQQRSTASRLHNIEVAAELKINAKAFSKVMADLPTLSPLDILRMAIHQAMGKDNWEDAARYAAMLAEYEQPKLARLESTVTNRTEDMTDEQLQAIINSENLS